MSDSSKDKNLIKYTSADIRFSNSIEFPDEVLVKIWKEFDWEKAENYIFNLQKKLTLYAYKKDYENIIKIQNKITNSLEGRMLAVKKVVDLKVSAGIDKVKWKKDIDKIKAVLDLNCSEYKAKPLMRIVIQDKRGVKERRIGIPTVKDRAMQILQSFALEPVAEAWADRKSFGFRKCRSGLDAHACLWDNLCDETCPEWVLITDVENYYETVSHDWILRNIPMNKRILKEFLSAGVCFNGELFPTEQGISLGSSISPMLGNMILDGLQLKLYDLQGETITDYKNGYLVRFADDIAITARTPDDAKKFKTVIEEFMGERGLRLSEKKTKIVNIKEGFDFLSRHYIKINNQINVTPSQKAIENMEKSLEDLILNPEEYWTQKSLIQSINAKLYGWATYHRVEESEEAFKHIDVVVNALLIKLMKTTYPNKTLQELRKKYWYKRADGIEVFSLVSNRSFAIINLADIVLVRHKRMDLTKNIFLNAEYFEGREKSQEINKVSGKYKSVWDRQEGKCYFCGKKINKEQDKSIIFKTFSKINRLEDMAYIHTFCKDDELLYLDTDIVHINNHNLNSILEDIKGSTSKKEIHKWKFRGLEDYFGNTTKTPISLKFADIEKILGFNLCDSANNYPSYWYQNNKGSISNAWKNQGYEILKLDLEKKKVSFKRVQQKSAKVNIPKVFLTNKIPNAAKYEIEEFFKYITKKYGLSNKK